MHECNIGFIFIQNNILICVNDNDEEESGNNDNNNPQQTIMLFVYQFVCFSHLFITTTILLLRYKCCAESRVL